MRILLIGAGFMGKEHLDATRDSDCADYIGIVDPLIKKARVLGEEFNIPAFASLDDAIKTVSVEAVDISVPTPFHLPVITRCAEAGFDILCEKPIALNVDDAVSIKAVCENNRARLMLAQVLRFWPEYEYAIEHVKSKTYGPLRSIECKRLSPPPAWNDWMTKPEVGGGAVIDLQIHDMDFILQLLGEPTRIYATGQIVNGAVNSVLNTLMYDGNVSVISQASYLMPNSYPFLMYYRIVCDEAVLEFDFTNPKGQRLTVFPNDGERFHPQLEKKNAYQEEIDYFCRQIMNNKPFDKVPVDDAIKGLRMCMMSKEACENNLNGIT